MTCGDCLHSLPLTVHWSRTDPNKHCHCAYGPGGDRRYVGAMLLRKDQACRFDPPRFEAREDLYDKWVG